MINVHSLVRGLISVAHPEESVQLAQGIGFANVSGAILPRFAKAIPVMAQIQSLGPDELRNAEQVSTDTLTRKAYLFSDAPYGSPAGIIRPLSRSGDLIRRADGTVWLVTAVAEDFSSSGWVCVNITLQNEVPEAAQEAFEEENTSQGGNDSPLETPSLSGLQGPQALAGGMGATPPEEKDNA